MQLAQGLRHLRIGWPTLFVTAMVLSACGGGRSGPEPPEPPVPVDPVACGGADLSALVRRVHVSEAGTDSADCGSSTTSTCRSIQQGLDNCAAGAAGCGVLVRYGVYATAATITLRDGVQLYGGCVFDADPPLGYRSVVQSAPPPGTPAVIAESITAPTRVFGLLVVGNDAGVSGTASIALIARDSSGLTLDTTTLAAGRGAAAAPAPAPTDGSRGDDGHQAFASASPGGGGRACPGSTNRGGNGSFNALSTTHTGFDAKCTTVNNPNGENGGGVGSVAGGTGGPAGSAGCACQGAGGNGAEPGDAPTAGPGNTGTCSLTGGQAGADITGSLDEAGFWHPAARAGPGNTGGDGSGGGGGGGGGYTAGAEFNADDKNGYAGGGGGGGGCGGIGGAGGSPGGASFAMVVAGAAPTLQGAVLLPGPGGTGADGGGGGRGGGGGSGGGGYRGFSSGFCSSRESGAGGQGGGGGTGGAGSGGAGGNGGPSAAIALTSSASVPPAGATIYAPIGGVGGQPGGGGASPCQAAAGDTGLAGANTPVQALRPAPAGTLVLGRQLLAARQDALLSPDGATRFVAQQDGNVCIYVSSSYRWCSLQFLGVNGTQVVQMNGQGQLCLQAGSAVNCYPASGAAPGSYLEVRNGGQVAVTNGVADTWVVP